MEDAFEKDCGRCLVENDREVVWRRCRFRDLLRSYFFRYCNSCSRILSLFLGKCLYFIMIFITIFIIIRVGVVGGGGGGRWSGRGW